MLLASALLLSVRGQLQAQQRKAPVDGKVAVGFSNLVARLDQDEIGFAKAEYRVHVLEALRAGGFNAVGAESLVFNRDDADKADLVLGGTVKELECKWISLRMNCRIGIEWELLDRERDAVVYRVLSRHVELAVDREKNFVTGKKLTLGALRALMNRPRFKALLNATRASLPDEKTYPVATFRACAAPARELPANFNDAAEATLIIKSKRGLGSGFSLGPDGLILTAAHVVRSATVTVRRKNGRELTGKVVRVSREHDVALIAVPGSPGGLPCLALEAAPQTPGSDIYAIGSPASEDLAFSLTRGIVSGVRTLGDVELIQTDASLSPGNSGGPLLDGRARVVGVVSRKIAGEAVEGLGFGIPIQDALDALKLEPGTSTAPSLLQPAAIALGAPSRNAAADAHDAMPSLDPEGDRVRLQAQDHERRVRERDSKRPAYIAPMRWVGLGLAIVGSIAVIFTGAEGNKSAITRNDYEDVRLKNDLAWIGLIAGSGSFAASFVLEPGLPPPRAQKAGSLPALAGPGNIRMNVRF